MIYRKLHSTYSNGYAGYIPRFRETFPELSKLDSEELANRLNALKLDFYCEQKKPVSGWVRFTLPLALIVITLMFVGLPINFWITGRWGFPLGKNNMVLNWFRSLGLQK